ncbi:MAG: hypothetical protein KAI81_07805 [Candidatus Marinimicrobia bacterium]|nr:hypothetical protein [Candidatus Neomarinimicrobiota bacterium]
MFNENLKRGIKVNYTPKETNANLSNGLGYKDNPYNPVNNTYVWAYFAHLSMKCFVIQHPEGHEKEYFLASNGFEDGFESIHSSLLKDGLKYIYADPSEVEIVEGQKVKDTSDEKEVIQIKDLVINGKIYARYELDYKLEMIHFQIVESKINIPHYMEVREYEELIFKTIRTVENVDFCKMGYLNIDINE